MQGLFVATFCSDSEGTPEVGEITGCPPSTGIAEAKVCNVYLKAYQFRDGWSHDLIIAVEVP
jgi:hypothetical protein